MGRMGWQLDGPVQQPQREQESRLYQRVELKVSWGDSAEELRGEDEEGAQAEYDFQQQAQLWDLIAKVTLSVQLSLSHKLHLADERMTIFRIREVQQPMGVRPEELLEQNKYLSPKSLVNAIFHSDRTLQEWTVSLGCCYSE